MNGHHFPETAPKPATILCAIDFSESSRHAIRWTVDMAEHLNAHIIVLYAYRLLLSPENGALISKKKMEEQAISNFSALEKDLLVNHGLTYEFRTEVGFVKQRIEEYLKENFIHLVIVGKTTNEDSKEVFSQLMEQIQVPMVIVP